MIFIAFLSDTKLIGQLLNNPQENLDVGCGYLTMRNKSVLSRTLFVMTMNGTKCD
jgi:hypothetical protein